MILAILVVGLVLAPAILVASLLLIPHPDQNKLCPERLERHDISRNIRLGDGHTLNWGKKKEKP